jgi:protein MpaA
MADPFAAVDRGALAWPGTPYGASRHGVALRAWLPAGPGSAPLVLAALHGNEPETTVALSAALRSVGPEALRSAVVLCANPDGALQGTRGNGLGVDLNRNFATRSWAAPRPGELPTGSEPASEPETRALAALVERLTPPWLLSIHADLACVDDPGPTALGRWLAGRSGLPLVAGVDYPTPGSLGSWCAERGLPIVTLELERLGPQALRCRWGPILAEVLRGAAP